MGRTSIMMVLRLFWESKMEMGMEMEMEMEVRMEVIINDFVYEV
jgi:hypothetical protein